MEGLAVSLQPERDPSSTPSPGLFLLPTLPRHPNTAVTKNGQGHLESLTSSLRVVPPFPHHNKLTPAGLDPGNTQNQCC